MNPLYIWTFLSFFLPQMLDAQGGGATDTIPVVAQVTDSLAMIERNLNDPFAPDADTFYYNRFLFLTPTAFGVKKGKYVFNHSQFILNTLNYGATDNLTIGGGVLPLFVVNTVFANAKWTVEADSVLRLGLGLMVNGFAQTFSLQTAEDENWYKWAAISGIATVTLGDERAYLNASAAKLLITTRERKDEAPFALGMGAGIMTSPRFRLFADGTFFFSPDDQEIRAAVVAGVSFIGKKKSGNLGFVVVDNDKPLILPVYSFHIKF